LFDRAVLKVTKEEKGYLWFKTFSASLGGGSEIVFDDTCAKCFFRHWEPKGHACFKDLLDGVVVVTSKSPQRLKGLCERMARVANSEDRSDFGHFSRSMWGLSASSQNSHGIVGVHFHVMYKAGFPVAYVIFDEVTGRRHVIQHMYTVPYMRQKGVMKELMDKALASISENYFSILHRGPFSDDALQFWGHSCGIDISRQVMDVWWIRFRGPNEQEPGIQHGR
jgi:hypothetical protein